jgi:hypothetical protein
MLAAEHQSTPCENAGNSGTCLRIYVGKSVHTGLLPTYEAIVPKAREMALSGATVIQGATGFGRSGKLHTQHTLHIVDDVAYDAMTTSAARGAVRHVPDDAEP